MIFVSGAPGNVGTELIRLLSARGHQVRALIRRPELAQSLPSSGVETALGDLTDHDSLGHSLAGVDRVFLNSAYGPAILAQKNLVDAAARAAVGHIVKLSWMGASQHGAISPLGRWQAEVESYLEASGVPWTILRANAFMQNYLSHIIMSREDIVYDAAGEGKASLVDARDVAAARRDLLQRPLPPAWLRPVRAARGGPTTAWPGTRRTRSPSSTTPSSTPTGCDAASPRPCRRSPRGRRPRAPKVTRNGDKRRPGRCGRREPGGPVHSWVLWAGIGLMVVIAALVLLSMRLLRHWL